jgi:hypothetical protein
MDRHSPQIGASALRLNGASGAALFVNADRFVAGSGKSLAAREFFGYVSRQCASERAPEAVCAISPARWF